MTMGNAEGNSSVCNLSHSTAAMNALSIGREVKQAYGTETLNLKRQSYEHQHRRSIDSVAPKNIRGEIMTIRAAAKGWQSRSNGVADDVEIVDLSVGQRPSAEEVHQKLFQRFQRQRCPKTVTVSGRKTSASPVASEQNAGRRQQPQLKFGIDSILGGDSDRKRRESADTPEIRQQAAISFSIRRPYESSSDCSSDEARISDERSASPLVQRSLSPASRAAFMLSEWNKVKLARFAAASDQTRQSEAQSTKGLKFHPYPANKHSSLTRNSSDPLKFVSSANEAGFRLARGKSESPNCRSGPPRVSLSSESGTFVPVRSPLKRRIEDTAFSFMAEESRVPRKMTPSPNPLRDSLTRGPYKRYADDKSPTTFRSVSDSDNVFHEDKGVFLRVPRAFEHGLPASNDRLSSSSWRASDPEPTPSSSSRLDLFHALENQRAEELKRKGFAVSSLQGAPLSSPPLSPNSPMQISLQTWQALAANCHPSLRHLMYPYPFGNAAAAAVALAAVRSQLKEVSHHGFGAHHHSAHPEMQPTSPADEEKRKTPKKRRKWSRAVFSLMQRRGLEKSFQVQKYVAKPERRGLADALGLTDAQVKIWFQNRRMKWRQELKTSEKQNPEEGDDIMPPGGNDGNRHGHLVTISC